MFGPIEDLLSSDEFDECGWVRVVAARWEGRTLQLQLHVDEGEGGGTLAVWEVVCEEVRDYLIADVNGGGLRIYDGSHPVVRQHTDRHVKLTFRGAAPDPLRAVGALWRAHRRASDDWIPFDRYINLQGPLEVLLASGSGQMAEGPRFLLEAYAAELQNCEVVASFSGDRPARHWIDGRWRDQVDPLWGMHFGNSFVVAERFDSRRVAKGAG